MCGLAGYSGFDGAQTLAAMSLAIAHRGPDGQGVWLDDESLTGLAHRRLSIIDTSDAAAQPMMSCDGRYVVVFNGEIYNFRELGAELKAHGYRFNENSDTAVIAPLYDLKGGAMLESLRGMFAFALWDRKKRELFVARDSFGVKPFYYARVGQGVIFASELKALSAYQGLDRTIDVGALGDYLTYLWSPGERTPLHGVSKLPPGFQLTVRGGRAEISRWSRPPPPPVGQDHVDERGIRAQLGPLFDSVVNEQCVSDVPIGAFLSGGLDSSAIVASMVATGNAPKYAYCVGFQGPSLAEEGFADDIVYAREVANLVGVPLREMRVKEPSASDLESLVFTLDEPEADPAPLYVGAIAQAARNDGIKVLFSGAGGDDVFSGYRRHRVAAFRARLCPTLRSAFSSLLGVRPVLGGADAKRRISKLQYMFTRLDEDFLIRSMEFNPRQEALSCLIPDARIEAEEGASNWLQQVLEKTADWPLVERMLDLELHGFLPDHNLNYTDKASMMHGVEVRVPFLDGRLLSYARRIPWWLKVRWLSEKWALKRGVGSRLPKSIITRGKTGFGGPVRLWMQGSMGEMISDLFASTRFRERGFFDPCQIDRALCQTREGLRDHSYLLFAVAMIELWLRRFVDAQCKVPS